MQSLNSDPNIIAAYKLPEMEPTAFLEGADLRHCCLSCSNSALEVFGLCQPEDAHEARTGTSAPARSLRFGRNMIVSSVVASSLALLGGVRKGQGSRQHGRGRAYGREGVSLDPALVPEATERSGFARSCVRLFIALRIQTPAICEA